MKKFLNNNKYILLLIVLLAPSVTALFHKGFYGASDDLHIAWLFQMDQLIKINQFPPRFVPDLSFGFGYPLFNFVFPFPFYLGEVFHLMGLTLVDSVKLVFAISLVGSGLTMYLLLRQFLTQAFSIAGSLVYVFTPYRSTDVYIRGAFGESLAFVLLPLLMLGTVKIYKHLNINSRFNWKYISLIAFSLGILILTHDIVSYMFFPFYLMFVVMLGWVSQRRRVFILQNVIGILAGLFISIYFWLPALIDSRLMKYSTVFDFRDHFPTIKQLISPYFGYGASVPGPYDLISFFMGHINLIAITFGILVLIFRWKKVDSVGKVLMIWALITLTVSIFMMNHRSTFLWQHLPFLPYFQFPWRFLTLTTLTSAVLLVSIKYLKLDKISNIVGIIICVSVIFINFNYFKPHDFLERDDFYYLNRYIPVPEASNEYLNTQEEYLRLTTLTQQRPDKIYPLLFSDDGFNATILETNGIYTKAAVENPENITLYYRKYYFPGWGVKIDGKENMILPGEPFGQISVFVPKGYHIVEFYFKETMFKLLLDLISLVTVVVLLFLLFKNPKFEIKDST